MIKNLIIFKRAFLWVGTLIITIFSSLSYAQDPVMVKALAVHYGSNIQFSYQVTNYTQARNIVSVSIGNRGAQPPDTVSPGNAQPELTIYPAGSYWEKVPDQGDSRNVTLRLGGTYTSPTGWVAGILEYEESSSFSVDWNIDNSNTTPYPVIQPRQTLNFSVTVPTHDDQRSTYTLNDPAYLSGHFTVGFDYSKVTDEGPSSWSYTGVIIPIDIIAPTLMVNLSPNKLWTPNERSVPVTATIVVNDNYDPMPEIKLESITANEDLDKDDIKGAQFGTDDRQFLLKAEREGRNKVGRIYTVTYSATDASGNKAIASATVTVPHDEREHEGRDRDEKTKENDKD